MDYSSIHESDNVGASPWGNSPTTSPQHNQSEFRDPIAPTSPSRFPYSPTGNGDQAEDPTENPFGVPESPPSETGFSQSSTGVPDGPEIPFREEQSQQGQQQPHLEAHQREGQQQQDPPQVQQQQRRPPQQLTWKLQAKITGIERTGRKDLILRFDVHTNLEGFRTTQFRDIRRLHSEFQKLADHLISANPEAIVPAVPPALTSAGAGTDEDEARVKAMMQRWLNYVCSNEVLVRDDEMILFVESDFGYSPMVKKKQPATGVRRKILKQFAPPPDDTPELQDARPVVKLFYLGSMDAGHKVDKLVKARRGLGLSESDFGVKLGSMNVQEPYPGLANAYRKLGKVIQTVGDGHAAQATAEATTLGDPFQYHSQDAFIVKETLTNRQILIREFIQARETTLSKRNAADRLRASSNVRREKVDEAIASLDEAVHHERYLENKTTRVTKNLVHERRKWFARTAADLRLSIREYVLREIEAERRMLALLETVRPDVRSIDASGGLSRLGRESHPTVRRSSLAASQGPKGDSWSGVPRRTDVLTRSISGSFVANPGAAGGAAGDKDVTGDGEEEQGDAATGSGSRAAVAGASALSGVDEDDEDRVDAKNAASRLAASTF
ncbi:Vacuolar protein sorting-associated protein 17 [Zalerion maritima]|uniref:Vacuolar protein sorting-associated protein 17 n=1 Tax=Zalerion maritima TaxID=339359 RepID=A0AAD5WNJ7_9PEZI|nr:Vacuolar protein sorting-associated protein 17 [Zalerion maritima]